MATGQGMAARSVSLAVLPGGCAQCAVRNRVICGALSPAEREALGRIGRIQRYPRGTTLVWEGEDSRLVANLLEGVLKLSTTTVDGREQILGVAYPSDFVGRLFAPTARYRISALTDVEVCLFARTAFEAFARDHPALEHALLEHMFVDLDRAHDQLLDLGRRSASARIAAFLLDLSQRLADARCGIHGAGSAAPPLDAFALPLDRQQIGDLMGLAIETVSRTLHRFQRAGLIALQGRRGVTILDRARLEALAEG